MSPPVAVGYARISKDDTLAGLGVARQRQDIEAVCARNGWVLSEVLVDNDISASRFSKQARPGYQQLLERIASGTVDRAVVYDLDRLLRIPRQLEDLIDLVETHPVEIHTVTGRLDLTTSAGRFTTRAIVAVAAMESDSTSRRLRRAFEQKAREGRPHGPRAFGYQADSITPDEFEAGLIRQAAQDVLDGMALNEVARRWDAAGAAPPQTADCWTGTAVRAVLTNPRQAGIRVYRGEVVATGVWEANLTETMHRRLVRFFGRPTSARRPVRNNPFGGIVTDINGVPLDRDEIRGRLTYRGHPRPGRQATNVSISAVPLERYVLVCIDRAIDSDVLEAQRTTREEGRDLSVGMSELEGEIELLAADYGAGSISRIEWLAAREQLAGRLDEAQRQAEAAQTTRRRTTWQGSLVAAWPTLSILDQASALRCMISGVQVGPAHQRGGPQPMVDGIGRIDLERIQIVWRA